MKTRVLAMTTLLLSATAAADWFVVTPITGSARDLVATDAGLFAWASQGAGGKASAWWVRPDGGSAEEQILLGNMTSAVAFPGPCLAAVNAAGGILYSTGCGTNAAAGIGPTLLRSSASGFSAILNSNLSQLTLRTAPTISTSFTPISMVATVEAIERSMALRTFGNTEFILYNVGGGLMLSVDAGAPVAVAGSPISRTVSLFEANGAPGALMVTSAGTMAAYDDVRAGGAPQVVTIPGGVTPQFGSFTTDLGDTNGTGFGLASSVSGVVLSPVPNPQRPGRAWVARTGVPQLLSGRVHCVDARFCVAFSTNDVLAYWNNNSPAVVDAGISLLEGQRVPATVQVQDLDGDPLFVRFSGPAISAVDLTDGGDGTTAELTTSVVPACSGATLTPVTVTVSDGLASHTVSPTFQIPVQRTRGPYAPEISPATRDLVAGGAPLTLSASVDGGCAPTSYEWTVSGMTSTGPTATVTPPSTWCSPDAGLVPVSVRALDSVDASVPTVTQVRVLPWGVPNGPAFGVGLTQLAGTAQVHLAQGVPHDCSGAPGFPGLEYFLVSSDGGPPGVTVERADGGVLVRSTDRCTAGRLEGQVVAKVPGAPMGVQSTPGTLAVDLLPDLDPVTATTAFSMGFTYDAQAGRAQGQLSHGANCPAQRGLEAAIEVRRVAGAVVSSGTFPAPGPWGLPVPGGCSGGDFEATARLGFDGGALGPVDVQTFTTAFLAVDVVAVTPTVATVRCGEGARFTLQAELAAGSCQAVTFDWQLDAGVPMARAGADGGALHLETLATDWSLAGQRLELTATADAGDGNGDSLAQSIELVPERFVRLVPGPRPALTSLEVPVELTWAMENASACDADGLEIVVSATHYAVAADAVRLDGRPVAAQVDGRILRLSGVRLGAGERRILSVSARPVLLGEGTSQAEIYLGGAPVTLSAPAPVPASCGCTGGGAGLVPLALIAWVLMGRRRRFG